MNNKSQAIEATTNAMGKLFKTILIDDEKLARNRLKRLLTSYPDCFDIIAEAENGEEGLQLVESLKPDLIFLDIQMPGMTGFEMLKALKHIPIVIFATAFEEYAIKAFEQNSIDYLLKPIETERLAVTVEKLKRLNVESRQAVDTNKLMEIIEGLKPQKSITSIPVKIGDKILLIKLEDIVYFEAKEKYVFIHNKEGKEFLIDLTLTMLKEKLPSPFVQIHRAYIINKTFIKEIHKYFDGKFTLILNDQAQSKITSGSSYTKEVKELFEI